MIDDFPVVLRLIEEPVALLMITVRIADMEPTDTATANALLELGFTTWMRGLMTLCLSEDGRSVEGFAPLPVSVLSLEVLSDSVGLMVDAAGALRAELTDGALRYAGVSRSDPGPTVSADPISFV